MAYHVFDGAKTLEFKDSKSAQAAATEARDAALKAALERAEKYPGGTGQLAGKPA